MNLIINRLAIAGYAIYKAGINYFKSDVNNKNIVIIFQQVFGDAVILLSTLKEYEKLFPQSDGYHIKLLLRPQILCFLNDIAELPNNIEYIPIEFKNIVNDYDYFKGVVNEHCVNIEYVIVPGTSLSAELLSSASNARRRIGLVQAFQRHWPPHMWLFQKLAYSEKVIPKIDEMMLQRHRRLLHYLGYTEFKAILPVLKYQKSIIQEKYIVIAPGASSYVKCWPLDRFVLLVEYIVDKYNISVFLCGSKEDKYRSEYISDRLNNNSKVHNYVGKLKFYEWSSLIQHADLVIGNDSATIHLAAAHKTKAICIAGVYDKYQFFPYRIDVKDVLPVAVFKEKECSWCRTKGYYAGYGNKKCSNAIKEGKPAKCISEIDVKDVTDEIEYIMKLK